MSLQKIDKIFDVIGKGLGIIATLASIILMGVVAYVILGMMDYTGFALIGLTILIALLGGFFVQLVVRLLAWFGSF